MPFLTKRKTNWKYILVVAILAIIVGGGILAYLRYFEREILSFTQFSEIKKTREVSIEEELAKETVNGYAKALMSRQKDNVLPYLTGEAKKKIQEWPPIFGTSNPHLGSFEILSTKKLDTTKFEFVVREYQEYTGEGIIGYNDETLTVEKINGKYLISKIETGEYVDIKETANWKSYRNEKYGFEIKYPLGVTFSSQGPNYVQQALDRGETISGTVMPSYDTIIFSDSHNEIAKIEIFHVYEKEISKENYWAELHYYGPCDTRWEFNPEVLDFDSVNGIPVLKVKGKDYLNASQSCYYLKNLSGNLIVLSNYKEYKLDIFNQMLSTFRFLE
jgi:hypothetical protein